jgi:hypothetical protein
MINVAVKCGCSRFMSTDGSAGRNAFRCGCGARVRINEQVAPVRRCSYGDCRTVAVTKEPLRFCLEHEKAAASILGPMAGALEVERFLNSSRSTRRRQFGDRIRAPRRVARHAPVVYYVLRSGLIKIGTSTRLRMRARELEAEKVLATEPGDETIERQRQRRFKHLHHHHEWYLPGDDLLAHIDALVLKYGPPFLS